MNNQGSSIADVLSGNKAVQISISLDYKTIGMLAGGLFLAVLGALFIYKHM